MCPPRCPTKDELEKAIYLRNKWHYRYNNAKNLPGVKHLSAFDKHVFELKDA